MRVELLLSPDCPNAPGARRVLDECLRELGLSVEVAELVGDFQSPTVLIDGVDVMTGDHGVGRAQSCRLDLPTAIRVLAALRRASGTSTSVHLR